ncbi:SDR family oxidoreductase [Pseudidiomarina sp. PP-1MA]|uniref:SDR family oxidoreductase n=1 Tax=Pseudidiomarina sp. PP-1MA TaxID=3237706 RepID=A0AB39X8Z0_9GAMM
MATFSWTNQHVLLTGAAGGLGRCIAQQLTAAGAKVLLVGRNSSSLEALAQQLQQSYLQADITTSAGQQALLDYVLHWRTTQMPVTGLINNAGINHAGLFSQQSTTAIAEVIQTNLMAPMQLSALILPYLPHQRGWLMNLGSVFGSIGFPGQTLYCASKFGLRGFTEALQRELPTQQITVMYCAPRAIDTNFNSPLTVAMNQACGSTADAPEWVARKVLQQIARGKSKQVLGWPERFFAWLNGFIPSLVAKSMRSPRQHLYRLTKELSK